MKGRRAKRKAYPEENPCRDPVPRHKKKGHVKKSCPVPVARTIPRGRFVHSCLAVEGKQKAKNNKLRDAIPEKRSRGYASRVVERNRKKPKTSCSRRLISVSKEMVEAIVITQMTWFKASEPPPFRAVVTLNGCVEVKLTSLSKAADSRKAVAVAVGRVLGKTASALAAPVSSSRAGAPVVAVSALGRPWVGLFHER